MQQSCGDGGSSWGLIFARADGSRIDFSGERRIYCARFDESNPATAIHVEGGTPRNGDEAYWTLVADARIPEGDAVVFPSRDVYFYVYDEADRANALSSATEQTTGRLVFHELACEPGGAVHFTIDASVGSELRDRSGVRVRGEFRAVVAHVSLGTSTGRGAPTSEPLSPGWSWTTAQRSI